MFLVSKMVKSITTLGGLLSYAVAAYAQATKPVYAHFMV